MDETSERHQLVNDEDVNEEELLLLAGTSISESGNVNRLGPLLTVSTKDTYSNSKIIEERLTLRQCNRDYIDFGGCKSGNHEIPEFDRCITKGCISPLRRFDNIIGHFQSIQDTNNKKIQHRIICLKPEILSSLEDFGESIDIELSTSIRKGYLWNLRNFNLCSGYDSDKWIYNNGELNSKISTALSILAVSFPLPLSAHSHHAWLESQEARNSITALKIFEEPQETTAVPGLLGTLQNNQIIDLAQERPGEDINIDKRYENIDIPSLLCKGHTAHSGEAGRVRRVCDKVYVRILNKLMVSKFAKACTIANKYNTGNKQWLLFCVGKMVYCTTQALIRIRNFLISSSSSNIHTATLYINSESHVAIVSISGGVLLRRDMNNLIISELSFYSDPWPDSKYLPILPAQHLKESLRYYFSTFFLLVPYIQFDRPPRTLIASVQSIQAVSTPFGAGTSSVAPTEVSKPLVYTPLYDELLNSPDFALSDHLPGQELMVCFANHNDTNEDCIMISAGSTARSLYSYLGYSVNSINTTEKVPPIGEYAHIKTNRWWKTYSRRQPHPPLQEKIEGISKPTTPILSGGDGRGRIISSSTTQSGQLSVKVLRYSTPVSGDKLASHHGQKGVIKLVKEEDMIWGVDENCQPLKFDIIVSLSSINNRLTVGQYYEMIAGAVAAKEGRRIIVEPFDHHDEHKETILYDGRTGEMIERIDESTGKSVPVLASWGISRIWQMTQMTWDKQHYTHNIAGINSISPPIGRTAGGGIKIGEMDSHSMEGSGLKNTNNELQQRKTCVDTYLCTTCSEVIATCRCKSNQNLIEFSNPFSNLVYNYTNVLTSGYVTKYTTSF